MLVELGKGRFILDTVEDLHARAAMEAYADACEPSSPALAQSIREQLGISLGSFICIETALRIVSNAQTLGRMREGYSREQWNQVYATLRSLAP